MIPSENRVLATPNAATPIIALIPAYNEERFIGSVVLKARRYVDLVLVVDDGSRDATADIAEAAGALVIRQAHNTGKAGAINTGFIKARELNAQTLILLDGDGQHDAADIPALIRPIREGGADLVVGSRFLGVSSSIPRWRVAGQQALNLVTHMASGVPLTDSQNGFRALSRRALDHFNFRTTGFSVESEMQFLIKEYDLVVGEVPITVNYDEKPKRNPFRQGLQVLNGILQMVALNRPLFFFGISGTAILAVGLGLALWVGNIYALYTRLAIGTAILSMTLCVIGVLTIFTGLILHTIRAYMTR